ncbi:unnamed protein product, partial [marine sediment metagenome]
QWILDHETYKHTNVVLIRPELSILKYYLEREKSFDKKRKAIKRISLIKRFDEQVKNDKRFDNFYFASCQNYLDQSNKNYPNCIYGLYKNGDHVGNLRLSNYCKLDNMIEMGWLIRKQNWGQGLATMSGRALCEYCFDNLKVRKIYLGAVAKNESAVHVYKKMGFKIEGILRKSFYLDKKYIDIIKMGMFYDELVK